MSTETTAAFGLAFGLIGTLLGIFSAWRAFVRDSVSLIVKPTQVFMPDGTQHLGVMIVNRSFFEVTVKRVAIATYGNEEMVMLDPFLISGGEFITKPGTFPKELKPRTSITIVDGETANDTDDLATARNRVCVYTDCGHVFYGSSPYLKKLIAHAKSLRKRTARV